MSIAVLSDEELTTFCFDCYRPVYEEFTAGMSRTGKVQLLVAYCERHGGKLRGCWRGSRAPICTSMVDLQSVCETQSCNCDYNGHVLTAFVPLFW